MKLWLTTLVYNCVKCGSDTTFYISRIKDIRRTIEMDCPYCESKKEYEERVQ